MAKLQAENIRNLPLLLRFLNEAGGMPASVLEECVRRLGGGKPAKSPSTEAMAAAVDKSLGARAAADLYDRFYRPSSTLAMHGGGWALLRHVREDGRLARRPSRTWSRRSPARIADACLGALTANMARRAGTPSSLADDYTERHFDRALTPVIVMSSSGVSNLLMPGHILTTIVTARGIFRYARSGQDADNPAARVARIRAGMAALLLAGVRDLPEGALDPFLDYVAEKIAAETALESDEEPGQAAEGSR